MELKRALERVMPTLLGALKKAEEAEEKKDRGEAVPSAEEKAAKAKSTKVGEKRNSIHVFVLCLVPRKAAKAKSTKVCVVWLLEWPTVHAGLFSVICLA